MNVKTWHPGKATYQPCGLGERIHFFIQSASLSSTYYVYWDTSAKKEKVKNPYIQANEK